MTLVPEGRRVFSNLTVGENLRLGAVGAGERPPRPEAELFSLFPVLAERRSQLAGTLSGGEQQQLAIARALRSSPSLLLLDEPSLGLAPQVVEAIFDLLVELRRLGTTILLVEQNVNLALEIADRAYVLQSGSLQLSGRSADLLALERSGPRLSRDRGGLVEVFAQQLANALALGGTYALLALGVAIVFSILGLVNFAHGELLTVTGYTLFFLAATSLPLPLTIVIGIAAAMLAALLMQQVAFRPFRGASGTTLLLTSFGVSVILQILFQDLIDPRGKPVPIAAGLNQLVNVFGVHIALLQLISIGSSLTLLIAISLFLSRTTLGISVRAAAQDFQVTRLMGIRANAVIATVFAASGLLAGAAGVLWVAQRAIVDPFMGLAPVLAAFVASVVGGLGSLTGAVVAGYLLGFIEIMVRAFLPAELQPLREGVVWMIVIGVLLLRPEGLFRRAGARP